MPDSEHLRLVEPAKVYAAADVEDCWVVEAPDHAPEAERTRQFSGTDAQMQALRFAHERFGSARFFFR